MEEYKLNEIIEGCHNEKITQRSMMVLTKNDDIEYMEWAWTTSFKKLTCFIKNYYILTYMIKTQIDEEKEGINHKKFNLEFLINVVDEKAKSTSELEANFIKCINMLDLVDSIDELKETLPKICKFINDCGYGIDIKVFKNPIDAYPEALEYDKYVGEGDIPFGKSIKEMFIDD